MKIVIDVPEERYKDIRRIAEVQLDRRTDTVEQIVAKGTPIEKTDGDLISRQAVIDMLNKLIEVEQKQGTDVMNYGRERVNAYESILDEIESDYLFPSITSAEKTAEWEWVQYESLPDFGNYHCSECRHIEHEIDGYNYCPNCGAKMKGEK